MEIKDLNKSQLILLAILLSFITSIATGITTVTLMQQAPTSVTVPINRVVRETVEKIQQVEGKTTVQTIVVKEEDLVVDAIEKNQSSVFLITEFISDGNRNTTEVSVGRGFAISSLGYIVADGVLAQGQETFYVENSSGKFKANIVYSDKNGFVFLKIGEPVDASSVLTFSVPTSADVSLMKRGQKIIVLGDTTSTFIFEGGESINIPIQKSYAGGLVLNLDGEVLGIALFNEVTPFASIASINASLEVNVLAQ